MKKANLKQARFLTLSLLTLVAFSSFNVSQAAPAQTASVIAGMSSAAQREAQAIELLRKFVTCPTSQVPLWRDFVDQITTLLAGIDEYKDLCKSLLTVRDEKPYLGVTLEAKKRIRAALMPHIATLKKIPDDIKKKCEKMSSIESYSRIKLS